MNSSNLLTSLFDTQRTDELSQRAAGFKSPSPNRGTKVSSKSSPTGALEENTAGIDSDLKPRGDPISLTSLLPAENNSPYKSPVVAKRDVGLAAGPATLDIRSGLATMHTEQKQPNKKMSMIPSQGAAEEFTARYWNTNDAAGQTVTPTTSHKPREAEVGLRSSIVVTPKPARSSIEISESGVRRVHDLSHLDNDTQGMVAVMHTDDLSLQNINGNLAAQFMTTQQEGLKRALNVVGNASMNVGPQARSRDHNRSYKINESIAQASEVSTYPRNMMNAISMMPQQQYATQDKRSSPLAESPLHSHLSGSPRGARGANTGGMSTPQDEVEQRALLGLHQQDEGQWRLMAADPRYQVNVQYMRPGRQALPRGAHAHAQQHLMIRGNKKQLSPLAKPVGDGGKDALLGYDGSYPSSMRNTPTLLAPFPVQLVENEDDRALLASLGINQKKAQAGNLGGITPFTPVSPLGVFPNKPHAQLDFAQQAANQLRQRQPNNKDLRQLPDAQSQNIQTDFPAVHATSAGTSERRGVELTHQDTASALHAQAPSGATSPMSPTMSMVTPHMIKPSLQQFVDPRASAVAGGGASTNSGPHYMSPVMTDRQVVQLPSDQLSPQTAGPVQPKYSTSRLTQQTQVAPQQAAHNKAYEVTDIQQNYHHYDQPITQDDFQQVYLQVPRVEFGQQKRQKRRQSLLPAQPTAAQRRAGLMAAKEFRIEGNSIAPYVKHDVAAWVQQQVGVRPIEEPHQTIKLPTRAIRKSKLDQTWFSRDTKDPAPSPYTLTSLRSPQTQVSPMAVTARDRGNPLKVKTARNHLSSILGEAAATAVAGATTTDEDPAAFNDALLQIIQRTNDALKQEQSYGRNQEGKEAVVNALNLGEDPQRNHRLLHEILRVLLDSRQQMLGTPESSHASEIAGGVPTVRMNPFQKSQHVPSIPVRNQPPTMAQMKVPSQRNFASTSSLNSLRRDASNSHAASGTRERMDTQHASAVSFAMTGAPPLPVATTTFLVRQKRRSLHTMGYKSELHSRNDLFHALLSKWRPHNEQSDRKFKREIESNQSALDKRVEELLRTIGKRVGAAIQKQTNTNQIVVGYTPTAATPVKPQASKEPSREDTIEVLGNKGDQVLMNTLQSAPEAAQVTLQSNAAGGAFTNLVQKQLNSPEPTDQAAMKRVQGQSPASSQFHVVTPKAEATPGSTVGFDPTINNAILEEDDMQYSRARKPSDEHREASTLGHKTMTTGVGWQGSQQDQARHNVPVLRAAGRNVISQSRTPTSVLGSHLHNVNALKALKLKRESTQDSSQHSLTIKRPVHQSSANDQRRDGVAPGGFGSNAYDTQLIMKQRQAVVDAVANDEIRFSNTKLQKLVGLRASAGEGSEGSHRRITIDECISHANPADSSKATIRASPHGDVFDGLIVGAQSVPVDIQSIQDSIGNVLGELMRLTWMEFAQQKQIEEHMRHQQVLQSTEPGVRRKVPLRLNRPSGFTVDSLEEEADVAAAVPRDSSVRSVFEPVAHLSNILADTINEAVRRVVGDSFENIPAQSTNSRGRLSIQPSDPFLAGPREILVQHADEVLSALGDSTKVLSGTPEDFLQNAYAVSDQMSQVAIPNIYSGPALDYGSRKSGSSAAVDHYVQQAIRPGIQLKMTQISGFVRGRQRDIMSPRGKTDMAHQAVSLAVTHVDKQHRKKPLSRILPKEDLRDLEEKFERLLGRGKGRNGSTSGRDAAQTIDAASSAVMGNANNSTTGVFQRRRRTQLVNSTLK